MAQLIMAEGAAPATPSTGKAAIYIDASGNLCKIDDAGNVMTLVSAGTFTLTIAGSGTAALLNGTQTFTGNKTFDSLLTLGRTDLTVASGAITPTRNYHRVETEGAAASDDLVTINGTFTGQILILGIISAARNVVLKTTGNIFLSAAADFTLDTTVDTVMLIYNGANWLEISRSTNT